jgi:hypothetical protein
MEEGDNGSLKLGSTTSVDCGGRERLPYDRLADVGSNEKGNAGAQSISLLE